MAGNQNPMLEVQLKKIVLNIGTGNDKQKQESARKLLELITKRKIADSISKRRIPSFGISKGSKIGAFVTIRDGTEKLAMKLFDAVDSKIKESSISNNTVSFGIREYIDISGIKYDPKLGMLGMNVNLHFARKGMRVATRKIKKATPSKQHSTISKNEIIDYLTKHNISVV
ncbi:MAG: 50S ribosomal protein L5 [Candidatus Micrarchaeaceae archaeon]